MNNTGISVLRLFVAFLACCVSLVTKAQITAPTPTSPAAATFSKIVNYPMNSNTGLPNIAIPLHEINIGGMKIPVTLQYHSGGFKIGEKSTNVGLGWSLSTDLQITRSINGMDDFAQNGYASNTKMEPRKANDPADVYYVAPLETTTASDSYSYAAGLLDGKPDKFSYKLLDRAGSFYMVNNGGLISYVPVPYDNVKIAFNQNQFVITDVDGSIYYFGTAGVGSNDTASQAIQGNEESGSINYATGSCSNCSVTTWKCMKIVNPTATDQITFTYAPISISTSTSTTDFAEYFDHNTDNNNPVCNYWLFPNSATISPLTTYSALLADVPVQNLPTPNYIEYKDSYGTLFHMLWANPSNNNQLSDRTFTYNIANAPQRESAVSIAGVTLSSINFRGGSILFNGTDQLNTVVIENQGQEVKTIHFYNSYQVPNNMTIAKSYNGLRFKGTLYLDSITITSGANEYEDYAFLYKTKFCFGSHLKGHDAWGYVNAKTMEIAADIPYQPSYPPESISENIYGPNCTTYAATVNLNGNGDEFPDEELMQSGILSTIVYPTGGNANFDWEANRYSYSSTDADGPSHRLLLGGGLRLEKISYYDGINLYTPVSQQYYTYGNLEDGEGTLLSPPVIKNVDGSLVYGNYSFTQEYYYGISSTQLTAGSLVSQEMPGFYQPCASNNCIYLTNRIDKTTYLPNSALDLTYAGGSPIYYNKITEYNLDNGRQTGKTVYTYYPYNYVSISQVTPRNVGVVAGTDQPLLRESWYLGNLQSEAYFKYVASTGSYAMVHQSNYQWTSYLAPLWPRVIYSFLHNVYNITEPGSSTSYSMYFNTPYATGAYLINTPNFIFSEEGIPIGKMLLSKKTDQWMDDAGDTISNVFQYSYNSMNEVSGIANINADSKGTTKTETLTYPYDYPSDTVYQHMVARNILSPVIEDVITNNTRELSRRKTRYAFLNSWFYAPDTSYSSYNGHPLEVETSFDAYDNFGNILGMTGRDGVPKSYFWGYGFRYPVAEVKGMNYTAALNQSGLNLTTLNNPSSDAQLMTELSKLRTLSGTPTLVKSFTYKPLVGVSSSTDPGGLSSYFDYDGLGRLLDERDKDQNVISKYTYSEHGGRAISRFYTNHPVIATVCNCYVEPSTGPGNNYLLPGGFLTASTSSSVADLNAVQQLEGIVGNGSVSTACTSDTSVHKAIVSLNTQIYLPVAGGTRPEWMAIDFIQNGHIVASRAFPNDDNTTKYLYLTPGAYQVSFRVAPFFRYQAIKLSFTNGGFLVSGNTITLQDHASYNLQATNYF